MPDPTFKIDSTTVLSKSGTTVSVDSGLNIKPAFSALDSSASNGPTSGTAVTKDTSAPIFACRAWVNFDGSDYTSISSEDRCAIRASGNVSKVVRNGTGDYSIYFTTALEDNNWIMSGSAVENFTSGGRSDRFINPIRSAKVNTYARVGVFNLSQGNLYDVDGVEVMVFR